MFVLNASSALGVLCMGDDSVFESMILFCLLLSNCSFDPSPEWSTVCTVCSLNMSIGVRVQSLVDPFKFDLLLRVRFCTYISHEGLSMFSMFTCGRLSCIDVLTLPRQTSVRPAGYKKYDPHEEVYCWSYGNWWPLPAVLSNLDDTKVIKT